LTVSENKFIATFLGDAEDIIQQMEDIFVKLEEYPGNIELINRLFRAIHTLKGSSSFMGFKVLAKLAHELENILDSIRGDTHTFNEDTFNVVLDSFGIIKKILVDIQSNGTDTDRDISSILTDLAAIGTDEKSDPEEKKGHTSEDIDVSNVAISGQKVSTMPLGMTDVSSNTMFSLLSSDEVEEIKSRKNEKDIYYLKLDFELETSMPVARAMLVIRELDNKTNLLVTVPPIEYLEEEFKGTIDFLFETSLDDKSIIEFLSLDKIRISELTKIENIDTDEQNIGTDFSDEDSTTEISKEKEDNTYVEDKEKSELTLNTKVKNELSARREVIRVDIQKLDQLMNLAGELVTNRTRNHDLIKKLKDSFKCRIYLKVSRNKAG